MRLGLLAAFVLLPACYEAPQTNQSCAITCTEGVPDNCPGDLVCDGGYCVGPGQICRPTFVRTAAGTGFACSLDDQGAVWCWGALTGTSLATRIDTTRHWDLLDAGGGQICGIASGTLYCWGENDDREVSGTVVGDVTAPLQIDALGITTWTAVSAGADFTCAIGNADGGATGQLFCWGKNDNSQLGDGTAMDRGVPTPIDSTLTDWLAVSAGDEHTCAVSASAGVHCWGRNARGELGPVAAGAPAASPVAVTTMGTPLMATQVAVATQSSCAITPTGEVYCWGFNGSGQLGDKKLIDPATVGQSAEPLRASDVLFTDIDGAQNHYCGLSGDAVYCWGEAQAGGMGTGIWSDSRVFQKVIAAGATDISVGSARNTITGTSDLDLGCAIVGADTQCWGDNRFGQLGQGTTTLTASPVEVAGGHAWLQLSAGAAHTCGIADDRTLYCWGSTERGQTTGYVYGASSPRTPCAVNATDPTQPLCDVAEPRALSYAPNPTDVATGNAHSCALSNGVVSCWGNLGGGNATAKRDLTQPGGAMWKSLYQTGRDGQCGTADAAMSPTYCIGSVLTSTNVVTRTAQLDGFTAIAQGTTNFGVFLDANGAYYGIGDNSRYQLGDGTTVAYAALTAIGGRIYKAISTRYDFVCAITPTDTVDCWGTAQRGQTGTATGTSSMLPNAVPGLAGCTAIATGVEHACAICGGAIQCWGDNRYGELAAAPSTDVTSMPRLIDVTLAGDPWVQLVAGSRHTCARSQAGHVYCWGFSDHGALGNGATGANLPVVVRAAQID